MGDNAERREKARGTWVSVVVSLLLAAAKLAAGVVTGSLSLIAEAAHSGLEPKLLATKLVITVKYFKGQ